MCTQSKQINSFFGTQMHEINFRAYFGSSFYIHEDFLVDTGLVKMALSIYMEKHSIGPCKQSLGFKLDAFFIKK